MAAERLSQRGNVAARANRASNSLRGPKQNRAQKPADRHYKTQLDSKLDAIADRQADKPIEGAQFALFGNAGSCDEQRHQEPNPAEDLQCAEHRWAERMSAGLAHGHDYEVQQKQAA